MNKLWENFNIFVTGDTEGEVKEDKNIWRNNGQKFSEFD